ncbi:putative ribosome-binding factor A, chloroplastic-like [Dorcoceras hygrometricum]|uniref:Putative ribosome-binding factor A, chloroplastic-like n=1 Tax=Dorcoceras hygrometricum TaxID=472368 RepID=A0A2Z7CL21_9LAMI|nr:putative ribosome-binding factor A, chloroplastic-like [Dorcoceras hygrometricum]
MRNHCLMPRMVSSEKMVVKVYVSVFGDERGKEVSLAGLKSKAKYVRSELGKRMQLRLTPEIRFIEDESFERGSRVLEILDRIKDENEKKAIEGEADDFEELSDRGNDDIEGDDLGDEGIIYVK